MPSHHPLSRIPRALWTLKELAKRESVTAAEFAEISDYTPENAKPFREKLEKLGVIAVREITIKGSVTTLEIKCTPEGRAAGEHAARADEAGFQAEKKRGQ